MASSIEDFVKRLVRINKKITFVFTEDFFNVITQTGLNTERYRDIRNIVKNMFHRKGMRMASLAKDETALFDVEVVIVGTDYACLVTSFAELAEGPFGNNAVILGYGSDLIDPEKAKFQLETFFAEKQEVRIPVVKMLAERKRRQLVLVVDRPGDLRRPSLERVLDLRHRLYKIMIWPEKGPIVDCLVSRLYQEGNSNSFSMLMNMFCVEY